MGADEESEAEGEEDSEWLHRRRKEKRFMIRAKRLQIPNWVRRPSRLRGPIPKKHWLSSKKSRLQRMMTKMWSCQMRTLTVRKTWSGCTGAGGERNSAMQSNPQ